jgi:hypothetical protein
MGALGIGGRGRTAGHGRACGRLRARRGAQGASGCGRPGEGAALGGARRGR